MHCDLLEYLATGENRTIEDPQCRCSRSQFTSGGVKLQTMAIFTETGLDAADSADRQVAAYRTLPESGFFYPVTTGNVAAFSKAEGCGTLLAIENASGLGDENPLEDVLKRFDDWMKAGPLVYVSLTWETENRFGGGQLSSAGLKTDGRALLQHMSGRRVAIDLSHTSDRLAFDILNLIDQEDLDVPVIASHSNFRSVNDHVRNLPDELVEEILKRGGIIGMNTVREIAGFAGIDYFVRQIQHGLKVAPNQLVCGLDWFYDVEFVPPEHAQMGPEFYYYPELQSAADIPALFDRLGAAGISNDDLTRLASDNARAWLTKLWS
jgi:microsomal dipeptidase-like Zn-dependent dipeptidase